MALWKAPCVITCGNNCDTVCERESFHSLRVILPWTCTNTGPDIKRPTQNQWSQTINNTRTVKKFEATVIIKGEATKKKVLEAMWGFNVAWEVMEARDMWGSFEEQAEGLGRLVIRWKMDGDLEEEVISEPSCSLLWPVTQDHSWTRLYWTHTHTPSFILLPHHQTTLLSFHTHLCANFEHIQCELEHNVWQPCVKWTIRWVPVWWRSTVSNSERLSLGLVLGEPLLSV